MDTHPVLQNTHSLFGTLLSYSVNEQNRFSELVPGIKKRSFNLKLIPPSAVKNSIFNRLLVLKKKNGFWKQKRKFYTKICSWTRNEFLESDWVIGFEIGSKD